ncbi:uncharacterized protein LOC115218928 [Argonauta hians]
MFAGDCYRFQIRCVAPCYFLLMVSPKRSSMELNKMKEIDGFDTNKTDFETLSQLIQEVKWESKQKDKLINDLNDVICNLKCRLRYHNLNDDVQLADDEIKLDCDFYPNFKTLLEKAKIADCLLSDKGHSEHVDKLLKENNHYKELVVDLTLRLHSNISTTSMFNDVKFTSVFEDVQEIYQKCLKVTQKLNSYEHMNYSPNNQEHILMEENKRLRNKLTECQILIKKYKALIHSCRETRAPTLLSRGGGGIMDDSNEAKRNEEELLALKTQIKIYAEDFQSERKDREKAQSRISDLESEILKLKQLHLTDASFSRQYSQPKIGRHSEQKLNQHRMAIEPPGSRLYGPAKSSRHSDQKELVSRGLSDGPHVNLGYQRDTIDSAWKHADKFQTDGISAPPPPPPAAAPDKQSFICPSCQMQFGSDKQAELLMHVDSCF